MASKSQEPEVRRILQDKDSTTFEVVVEGAGLLESELEKLLAEEAKDEPQNALAR